jgi:hypothetical protein
VSARKRPRRELFACPNCGADVALGAKACRDCGSDASTGWQDEESIQYAQVDLPDGYRDERETSDELPPLRTMPWVRWTALLIVAAMLAAVVIAALVRTGA